MMNKYRHMIKWEIRVSLKEMLGYKANLISEFLLYVVLFLSVMGFSSTRQLQSSYRISADTAKFLVFLGYVFWQFSIIGLGYSSSSIGSDARRGILEVKMQSDFSYPFLNFVRILFKVVFSYIFILFFLVLSRFFFSITLRDLGFLLLSLVVVLPAVVGMYGIGLVFGGISLKEKQISQVLMIVQGVLLFFSNIFQTGERLVYNLIPFCNGITIIRNLYVGLPVSPGQVVVYIATNLLWLVLGLAVFSSCLGIERRKGGFSNY